MTLVILAAGVGSRYGGLKQLDAVGPHNQSILDYSVYDALQAGFDRIVFVIRKEIEGPCREFILERYQSRIPCELVFQELDALPEGFAVPAGRTKPWGTGHAVLVCSDVVDDPFCVINADDFYGRTAYTEMARFLTNVDAGAPELPFAMVAFSLANTLSEHGSVSRGACEVDSRKNLVSVTECTGIQRAPQGLAHETPGEETRRLADNDPVSLNFWGFTPGIFSHLERQFGVFLQTAGPDPKVEFYLPGAVDQLIQEQKAVVSVLESAQRWVGVTYQADKALVMAHIQDLTDRGDYPEKLW